MSVIKKIYRFLNPKFQTVFLDYKVDSKPRYGHGKLPHSGLYDIINSNRKEYKNLIDKALEFKYVFQSFQSMDVEKDDQKPVYNSGFLPGLDIVSLFTLISEFKPKRYVEVGSGNSTKVAYAAKKHSNLKTEITSIDPMPRAEIDQLADVVIRKPFENTDLSIFHELEENDFVFIDNSHRILPNSDATVFFLEILPLLKRGVIVHIHDIYIPYDYPQFMCDRFYSEQYGLAFYILANPEKYKTLFPCYFISEDKELSGLLQPIWNHENLKNVERHGGSFWLKIS
jgi:predicted O-methyltransferase YrrM